MKHCLSCHQDGHTYLECPSIPFGSLIAHAFGVPDFLGPPPDQLAEEIAKAERYKQYLELKEEFEENSSMNYPLSPQGYWG